MGEGVPAALQRELDALARPLLILSTAVGKGMWSLGEAARERAAGRGPVEHRTIEEFLPASALREDVARYRAISTHAPWLLHLPYRIPAIYRRKLLRERYLRTTDLGALAETIRERPFRSVLAVSHRPAFWAGIAKERHGLELDLVGLSGEYGSSLGWRFVPWGAIARFLSPVPRAEIRFRLPDHVGFQGVALPARADHAALADHPGRREEVLVVCGSWGQGRLQRVASQLVAARPDVIVHAVCGENERARSALERDGHDRVRVHGALPSLVPVLRRCASVVSKPGIATVVEAAAARRKLFLVRGMPVAEGNNLRYALRNLGAERYSRRSFVEWYDAAGRPTAAVPELAP
jgi:hypothetical protein